jgi:hypothetical protein
MLGSVPKSWNLTIQVVLKDSRRPNNIGHEHIVDKDFQVSVIKYQTHEKIYTSMQDILDTTDDIPMDEVGKKDIQLFRSR